MIGAILLGNNVVNILSASLATALLTRIFGDSGVAFATLGMTLLVLIFGEVLPKTFAITNAEAMALRVAPVINVLIFVFAPIVGVVRILVRGLLRAVGVKADPGSNILAVREEIVGALSIGHSEGVVEKEDRDRILGALHLSDRTVEEVMLHRSKIEMIDASLPPQQVLELVLNSSHTRLPIWKDDPENIVGVLHAKDLLRAMYAKRSEAQSDAEAWEDFDFLCGRDEALFRPRDDDARRPDAPVPAPAHAFRAGGGRIRLDRGAHHARGHPRGDRGRDHRRVRHQRRAADPQDRGRATTSWTARPRSATSTARTTGTCRTRRPTPWPGSSSTRRRRSRRRGRSSRSTDSGSRSCNARTTGSPV
jgi:hypothetical protein